MTGGLRSSGDLLPPLLSVSLALPHTNVYGNAGGMRSSPGFFHLCHSSVSLLPFPVSL